MCYLMYSVVKMV